MRRGIPITAVLLALAIPAATAFAQAPGVIVEPDSPAGQEYAIPFDQARRDAAGGGVAGGRGGAGAAPLFGAGVSRKGEGRSGRGAAGAGRGARGAGGSVTPQSDAARGDTPLARELATDGGGSAGATAAAIVAAILLTGGLLGWALRRRPTLAP